MINPADVAAGYATMSSAIRCPSCQTAIRVTHDTNQSIAVRCPKCAKTLRLNPPAAQSTAATQLPPAQSLQVTAPSFASAPHNALSSGGATKPKSAGTTLQPFLRRWMIGLVVVMVVIVITGIIGLWSEPLAMASTGIGIVCMIGFILAGRIWIAIDLMKSSILEGVAALLVPLVGVALAVHRRGPALRGLVVYGSVIPPLLLTSGFMLAYKPLYTPAGRRAAQEVRKADLSDQVRDKIRQHEQESNPNAAFQLATFKLAIRNIKAADIQPTGERLLKEFDCYEAGSLQVDLESGQITMRYRGHPSLPRLLGLLVQNETRTIWRLQQ